MHHLRLKGGHYEMGVKRGRIFQRCNIFFSASFGLFSKGAWKTKRKNIAGILSRSM